MADMNMEEIKRYSDDFESALLKIDRIGAKKILYDGLKIFSPIDIANEIVTVVLEKIGRDWEKGELSLSQVYMSGKICEEVMDQILPLGEGRIDLKESVALVVLEDYHVLGKRIVYSALRAAGYELTDLGAGVSVQSLTNIVREKKIKMLLISTLILPSALKVKTLRTSLQNYDLKIVVGGAPFRFDSNLWKEVGADAFGYNASDALKIIEEFKNEYNS